MKFGVRECADVVLRAKATQTIGKKTFYKNEPVMYFDTLKTSTLEGAATTVYAQGGAGNARLMAWEGERTLTFTMEDALISPTGLMILSGAGLIEADAGDPIYVHTTETTDETVVSGTTLDIYLKEKPFSNGKEDSIYVMLLKDGEWNSEPYIATPVAGEWHQIEVTSGENKGEVSWSTEAADENEKVLDGTFYKITVQNIDKKEGGRGEAYNPTSLNAKEGGDPVATGDAVFVDYYVEKVGGAQQIDITPDKFGGYYYLEASTLFKNNAGVDMPAEIIIPKCKVQSNFSFSMSGAGDPSSFTFTLDAFPDVTRFDKTKKVLCSIQIVETEGTNVADEIRKATNASTAT